MLIPTRVIVAASLLLSSSLLWNTARAESSARQDSQAAIHRALDRLAREVASWREKNKCFSCHNNGDAARVLYIAARFGYRVDAELLSTTTHWLSDPPRWKHNGGEGIFNEKKLASIQFGSALVELATTNKQPTSNQLRSAAEIVAGYLESDGHWQVEPAGNLGSPATYGNVLATVTATRLLRKADAAQFAGPIGKAEAWLVSQTPKTTLDAAATLIGLADLGDARHDELRERCLDLLERGQDESGGWGPYVVSPSEPFDSALALLALATRPESPKRDAMIRNGQRYLLAAQSADGLWTETTRPAGAESYAQRISTSSWATLALIATMPAKGEAAKP